MGQHQQKIQELEELRKSQEKKLEGIKEFETVIKRLCNQNSLTENELYVSRSEQIEAWILAMAKEETPSSIYANLKKHFARTAPRGPRAAASKPENEQDHWCTKNMHNPPTQRRRRNSRKTETD